MVDTDALNAENQKYLDEMLHYKNENRLMRIKTFAFGGGVIVGAYFTLYVLNRRPAPKDTQKQ